LEKDKKKLKNAIVTKCICVFVYFCEWTARGIPREMPFRA